jgi:hypothetical protein
MSSAPDHCLLLKASHKGVLDELSEEALKKRQDAATFSSNQASNVGSLKKICSLLRYSSSWSKSLSSRSFSLGLKTRLFSIFRRFSASFAKKALSVSGCVFSISSALPLRKSKYAALRASSSRRRGSAASLLAWALVKFAHRDVNSHRISPNHNAR